DATNSTLSLANVPPSQGGAYSVVVTNQLGSTISAVATLTVIPNSPPVLAPIGDRTASESTPLSFTAIATDPDSPGQVLTYSLDAGAPNGASINPATGLFSWIPSEGQGPSLNLVTIRVTDNGTPPLSDFETINITVQELTTLPVLTPIGNKTVTEGSLLTFTASASDADVPAQTLKFTLDAGA